MKYSVVNKILLTAFVASANAYDLLKDYAGDLKIGVAGNTNKFSNASYINALKAFNMMVAENGCKLSGIQQQKGVYNFNDCDNHYKKAKELGMEFRGHCLVWHSYQPSWFENADANTLKNAIVDHITKVLQHYEGKIKYWDVVNEAIDDGSNGNGWNMRRSFLYNKVPNFVDLAFQTARKVSPNTKLFYNDYNAEGQYPKSESIYNFVADLKKRNIPIDGVGLQYHVSSQSQPTYDKINNLIGRYCKLGLEVHITELDVKLQGNQNGQTQAYTNALKACLANSCCKAFLVWGVGDNDSWLGANEQALLFNGNYQPKAVYNSLLDILKKSARPASSGNSAATKTIPTNTRVSKTKTIPQNLVSTQKSKTLPNINSSKTLPNLASTKKSKTLPNINSSKTIPNLASTKKSKTLPNINSSKTLPNLASTKKSKTLPNINSSKTIPNLASTKKSKTLPNINSSKTIPNLASTRKSKTLPNISSSKTIPNLASTKKSKTLPNINSSKTIPNLASTKKSKTLPNINSSKTIPNLASTKKSKTLPNINSSKTIPNLASTKKSKTLPNINSSKTIPNLASTKKSKTLPNINSSKTIPNSTKKSKTLPNINSSKTLPKTKTLPMTKTLPKTKTLPNNNGNNDNCVPTTVTVTVTVTVNNGATNNGNNGNCVAKWGQCGGINYNGPTCCQSGSTCKQFNEWYHQCV